MSNRFPDVEQDPSQDTVSVPIYRRWKIKRATLVRLSLIFTTFLLLSSAIFYLYLRFTPLPQSDVGNHSRIVAADGTVLADLFAGGQNRVWVSLSDIPRNLQHATIAIEDSQFYNHNGFDIRGIARALYVDLQEGALVQGGSTITQQLAKNLFLTQDRTWSRKFREAMLTVQLELNYSKDEILEQYLNVIYYGQGAYGAEMAAQTYFGKSAKDLNLAESSMLAGIPQGPEYYSPFYDEKIAKSRQRQVLEAMVKQGYITAQQANEAFATPLKYVTKKQIRANVAPYFASYVQFLSTHSYGIPEDELYRGGLTIQTTLDPKMQKAAEAAVARYLPNHKGLQAALIAMDPRTGAIKAMVGGRNFADSSYDRVFAKRQPGSSFKPFVYLTALASGKTPATMIESKPATFTYDGNKTYAVHNFNNIYVNAPIDMRTAISRSDNVYAVTTAMNVGLDNVVQTAHTMGIDSVLKPYPSLALGTFPVTPFEMARAYSTIANLGQKTEPYAIEQVQNMYGREIFHQDRPEKQQVADPRLSYMLVDLMKGVFEPGGTAARATSMIGNRIVAGKTGSTDTDAWMAGFTPNLVTIVWVGYDKDHLLAADESYAAVPIWGDFMRLALEGTPSVDFNRPDGLVEAVIDPTTGGLATENCPTSHREFFLPGTVPITDCSEHPSSNAIDRFKKQIEKTPAWKRFWNWFHR